MEAHHYFSIIFKYGGYWISTEKQLTRRYEETRQRTMKIHKDLISFSYLQEEILKIFPWVVGNSFELHYHVLRTSPKEYKLIATEDDSREMVAKFERADGAVNLEMIISTPSATEGIIQVHEFETNNDDHIVEGINDVLLEELCEDEQAFIVGTHFEDSTSFKNALRSYSITNNFGMKLKKSDRKRVVTVCSYRGCPWRVRATVYANGHTFEIRKIDDSHSCPDVNRVGNKQATTTWIASQIQDLVKKEPDVAPKQIKNNLENTFGLSLPYMKLWRSREITKEIIFGSEDANYSWVPTLRSELVKRNSGSHIIYKYDEKDNSFQRFFISFKASIEEFLVGCRPLIGVDACHLKSKYLGVLLSTNALDGNNGLFTLAFVVVETESKQIWEWFLENLLLSIGFQLHPLSFVSDMEKGLLEALTKLFLDAEHRVCLR